MAARRLTPRGCLKFIPKGAGASIPLHAVSFGGGQRIAVQVAPDAERSEGQTPVSEMKLLLLDTGSSTLAFCDSSLGAELSALQTSYISCNQCPWQPFQSFPPSRLTRHGGMNFPDGESGSNLGYAVRLAAIFVSFIPCHPWGLMSTPPRLEKGYFYKGALDLENDLTLQSGYYSVMVSYCAITCRVPVKCWRTPCLLCLQDEESGMPCKDGLEGIFGVFAPLELNTAPPPAIVTHNVTRTTQPSTDCFYPP